MATRGEDTKAQILTNAEALILERGFVGTSIDEILAVTGITKGAFFYHFKNKAELARALIKRFWEKDSTLLEQFSQRADELSDDPLQSMLIFLKLFEEYIELLNDPSKGCLLSSYIHESKQFDEDIKQFIANSFREWGKMYERRIELILQKYPPKIDVSARELAETIICIIEGGFILSKSLQNPKLIVRTSRQFRCYLKLLFEH